MANKVTNADIKQMNELYLVLKTYAAVARETGFSAGTVKRYIIPNYTPAAEVKKWSGTIPEIDYGIFEDDWSPLLLVREDEKTSLKELWKEISI